MGCKIDFIKLDVSESKYVCNNERVEKLLFVGYTTSSKYDEVQIMAIIIFKDGTRYEVKIKNGENYITETEKFIDSIC